MTGLTRQVNATLPKKLFKAVKKVKQQLGYNWPEFIVRAAERMDEHGLMEEELDQSVENYLSVENNGEEESEDS